MFNFFMSMTFIVPAAIIVGAGLGWLVAARDRHLEWGGRKLSATVGGMTGALISTMVAPLIYFDDLRRENAPARPQDDYYIATGILNEVMSLPKMIDAETFLARVSMQADRIIFHNVVMNGISEDFDARARKFEMLDEFCRITESLFGKGQVTAGEYRYLVDGQDVSITISVDDCLAATQAKPTIGRGGGGYPQR